MEPNNHVIDNLLKEIQEETRELRLIARKRKDIIDKKRIIYEKEDISDIIRIHYIFYGSCPSQGKMSDETYKKRLIEDLLDCIIKIYRI